MKTIDNPNDLKWQLGNLPSAELCNSESRIIVMRVANDEVNINVCRPVPNNTNWYWNATDGSMSYRRDDEVYWAWYKRFD